MSPANHRELEKALQVAPHVSRHKFFCLYIISDYVHCASVVRLLAAASGWGVCQFELSFFFFKCLRQQRCNSDKNLNQYNRVVFVRIETLYLQPSAGTGGSSRAWNSCVSEKYLIIFEGV